MSSSLDDLEPYEFFQQELDEYLKQYQIEKLQDLSEEEIKKRLPIINRFIEFVCFTKTCSTLEEINKEEVFLEFHNHELILNTNLSYFGNTFILKEFIKFIM